MADRLEWFDVTIPAGTPKATPATFPMVFFQGVVTEIDIKVLSGPGGTVGFFIGAGGSQYVPRTPGSYVRPDDDYLTWPMDHAVKSGSWFLTGYNTDTWDHDIQVGFQVNEYPALQPAGATPVGVSSDQLVSALDIVSVAPVTPVTVPPETPVHTSKPPPRPVIFRARPPFRTPPPVKRPHGTS